jgi:HAD superfamily hydrolase (TIGR01509 family)
MIINKKCDWIFFDLDGTLADSLPAMYQIYLNFLNQFEKKGTRAEFEELNGPALPEIIMVLKIRYGLVDDEVFLIDLYKRQISDAYKNVVKPINGAADVLETLKNNGYKLLLVTSASREIASDFVKRQKWDKYFQDYVYGDEINKAKPASEIYDFALKKAGVSSDAVIVVEDSSNGVKSAKGTGAFVVGLANNHTKEELSKAGADITLSRLKEILSILEVKV